MDSSAPERSAPGSVSEFLERLDEIQEDLPKRLRQCAEFTRRHLHLIAVSTVSDMAKAAGVAPSVYMRFCQVVGFSGYSEMQHLFRAHFAEFRPSYQERLANLRKVDVPGARHLLAEFAEAGHRSLLSLSNTVTSDGLDRMARGMAEARVIHLVGLRRAFSVVSSMSYMLGQLGVPATLHFAAGMLTDEETVFPGDALFAVTFAPFSSETVRMARSTAERDIPVYALSDTDRCPLGEFAKEMLVAREDEVAGFRALNASITLTTTLAVAIKALQKRG